MPKITEHPILFSGEMIRAILAGRKTQTRRIVKPQPEPIYKHLEAHRDGTCEVGISQSSPNHYQIHCPHGKVLDRLWVRESHEVLKVETFGGPGEVKWRVTTGYMDGTENIHTLTDSERVIFAGRGKPRCRRLPGIFMPRWASRLTLEITEIRVERLRDISEADALAEGITWPDRDGQPYRPPIDTTGMSSLGTARDRYSELWESIHGPCSWALNSFVWAITFKTLRHDAVNPAEAHISRAKAGELSESK